MASRYIIVGDAGKYEGCLIRSCASKDNAEQTLERMLSDPTDNDKKMMEGHTNIRIEEVTSDKCWWEE